MVLEDKFSIYPNPSNGIITLASVLSEGKVELYTTSGIKVHSRSLTGNITELDLQALDEGIYVVKLYHADGVSVGKVVLK